MSQKLADAAVEHEVEDEGEESDEFDEVEEVGDVLLDLMCAPNTITTIRKRRRRSTLTKVRARKLRNPLVP